MLLRHEIVPHAILIGQEIKSKVTSSIDATMQEYVDKAFAAAQNANRHDENTQLHPLCFSAAVVYDDYTTIAAWMLKGLEYGCTLDPVAQLLHTLQQARLADEHRKAKIPQPVLLIMIDQFGIAHAPFAMARSLLLEHGYAWLQVAVHEDNADGHVLILTTVEKLVPPPGSSAQMLSNESFTRCGGGGF
jgi:hypothetical protein